MSDRKKELRRMAEKKAGPMQDEPVPSSPEEARRTLHELRVHQIELEMQNDELLSSEEALDASRRRYFELYDLAPVGYCTLDERGAILEANLTAAVLLGESRSALAGQPFTRFVAREDQDIYYLNHKRLVADGKAPACELRLREKDGTVSWIRLETSLPRRTSREADECLAVISDISARKAAEQENAVLAAELEKKRRDLEAFLYITTHDIRGSLINIDGYSQNLVDDLKILGEAVGKAALREEDRGAVEELLGKELPVSAQYIRESSVRISEIIDLMLKLFRFGHMEMRQETVDAGAVLKGVLDELRFQIAKEGITVKTGELPACKCDPEALKHILVNLLSNAIKYRSAARALEITVLGERTGSVARYSVRDNGRGIKAKDLPRVWETFYSGDNPRLKKGEGIGLSISRMMAEKNSGRLWAESKEGEGSVFHLEMPS